MRLYLSVAFAALAIGVVFAEGTTPACDEETISVCCATIADLTDSRIQKVFGADLKLPEGKAGVFCALPSFGSKCIIGSTPGTCLYFSQKFLIAAGCV